MNATSTCPAWCYKHQLRHMPDGRIDFNHLHVVDRLAGTLGNVEIYLEADGKPAAFWGADNSTDPDHVRRLGHALLEAADTMASIRGLGSPHDG